MKCALQRKGGEEIVTRSIDTHRGCCVPLHVQRIVQGATNHHSILGQRQEDESAQKVQRAHTQQHDVENSTEYGARKAEICDFENSQVCVVRVAEPFHAHALYSFGGSVHLREAIAIYAALLLKNKKLFEVVQRRRGRPKKFKSKVTTAVESSAVAIEPSISVTPNPCMSRSWMAATLAKLGFTLRRGTAVR